MKHQRHMQQILEGFKDFEFYVNLMKCKYNMKKIEFLSFIVFIKEIQTDSKKKFKQLKNDLDLEHIMK